MVYFNRTHPYASETVRFLRRVSEISADRNISELWLFPLRFIALNLWQIIIWQHLHQLDIFLPGKKKKKKVFLLIF